VKNSVPSSLVVSRLRSLGRINIGLFAVIALTWRLCTGAAQAEDAAVISLGPEINVGASYGFPHLSQYQADLRCDPADPRRMCISCKRGMESETMIFHTVDGGLNWKTVVQPRSGDPDVVYDLTGAVHWSFIDNAGQGHLACRRSKDAGATWTVPRTLPVRDDHPQSVVDRSNSPYRGTIYIAGRSLGFDVSRSRDGGKTFQTTHVAAAGKLGVGFVYAPVVLAGGELLIPVLTNNQFLSDGRHWYAGNLRDIYCLRSVDGGVTFESPIHVTGLQEPVHQGLGGASELGGFAAGRWKGGQRVYLTFSLARSDLPAVLMLATSDDGGRTWAPPRAVAPNALGRGAGSSSVMVNREGIVGVQWYGMSKTSGFDIYFTASVDGGATFSAPLPVTSAASQGHSSEARYPGQDQVYGDCAPDDTFRLVWTDARDRAPAYVLYFRQVSVGRLPLRPQATLSVACGFGGGVYKPGETAVITAAPAPPGKEFAGWSGASAAVIDHPERAIAEVRIPCSDVSVAAKYRPQSLFRLTVVGGTGNGSYPANTLIGIKADQSGGAFNHWTGPDGVGFINGTRASTEVMMPAHDVTITAQFAGH
jgi:hypothetical protein